MTLKELGSFVEQYNAQDIDRLNVLIDNPNGIKFTLADTKGIHVAKRILDFEEFAKMPCSLVQALVIDELNKQLNELLKK